ncbi:melatonin receptor type 1B-B-like [Nymphalis io]|uniref:melatonin receptor type 1B-B-like n=1 Tax=Inachis io TaxID=171585 RepID=UPI002166EC2A|nr:melatonin receptor type 1B-B-like [Nymphalis io]
MPTDAITPMITMITFNGTELLLRTYSPVTLSQEWPKISRFLIMLFCACIGSIVNGFFLAAFFIESALQRAGNIFLSCVGLADIMMTAGVTAVSAVVILSGQWDTLEICKALYFLGLSSTYCYCIFFVFVAVENYYRICRSPDEYAAFLSIQIVVVCILIIGTSMGLAGVGVYLDLDYDYCKRVHYGNYLFRLATMVILQAMPSALTVIFLLIASAQIKRRVRLHAHYKRSLLYESDLSITAVNTTAYLIFVLSWIPYIIVVHQFPTASDAVFYNMMALGVFRSSLTSFLYGMFDRNFRRAYGRIFNYCCCKNSLSSSFSHRHRRTTDYKSPLREVRVHIMHQAVTSSQRGVSYWRETQEL